MKKLFTLTIMALVLMMTNLAWGQTRTTMELTFPLTTNPGGWPTTQSNELTNYVYTLNEVDYTFALKNIKCNNGYLMMYQVAALGLPAIDGYKLITVAASNSSGCSTSTKVGISSSADEANYIDGGAIQQWSTQSSTYTYNLTSTDVNTMYYLYVTNKNAQVTSLTLTYEQEGGTPTVAAPTFSPAAGTYYEAQNVTIGCATEGATIYYTLDGTDPTTESTVYSTPIAITETTTVKALGVKEGMNNSNIVTATYTIAEAPTPITIAEARALANNEYALVQGIVTFIDGRNVYVQDATAGIDLYLNNNTVPSALAIGDMVLAYGQKTVYNGLIELKNINGGNAEQFSIVSTGNELPAPVVKTIGEILTDEAGNKDLQSSRVQIVGATIGAINLNGNTAITQDEQSVNIYKIPAVEGLLENDIVTVTSVVARYNGNLQLRVAFAADVTFEHPVVQTVATPTFDPAAGTYYETQNVTIACTTEGATIYYTLDGTDPTTESTEYTAPIEVVATTTVKAFAVKEGLIDSDIATALYTIEEPATPTDYTLITHNVALVPGDKYIIVGIKSDTLFKAMGKQNANNRAAEEVTPVNNVVTVTPATTNDGGGVFELTLGQDSVGYWTLYDAVNGGYLYAAGTGNQNYLKSQAANDAKGQWTIDIAANGVATIKAPASGTERNWMRFNTNGSIFSCYGSGQLDVYLYKAGDIPQPTYYTVSVAEGITNGTVTVNPESATEGATITVTATPASGYELATLTYTYGETTNNIDPTTMQFVMPAANVTVNATFAEMASVATPTFTPAAGTYITTQYATIACETEGATIYYTLDGTDPTIESTVYADSITISATTTVKAFAVKEGLNDSEIASATYTIVPVMTIAEAKALDNNAMALVQAIVTFIDGRNIYVQDTTAGIDLYLNNNTVPTTLAIGDMVLAYGKKTVYNGLTELTSIDGGNENVFRVISTGNELPAPVVKTIAEILTDEAGDKVLQSSRVQIVEAIIGTINLNGNTAITQGENSVNIYKIPAVEGLLANDIVTVTSVVARYNGNLQLRVAYASDVTFEHPVVQTVATPTFAPEAGTYYEAQNVTIACETEGATIYYTLDGTDPTVESAVYSTPIAIAETTTVKAFAVKEGMNDSEIAAAEYVITAAPTAKDYTLITHNVALVPGEKYLIVSVKNDTLYKALGKQKTSNRDGVDVTITNNVINVIPSTSIDGGVFELTLGQDSVGYWTLYDAVNGGYLYAASSSSNHLKTQATNDANGQWTIDIAYNGVATITAQGANTRNLLRYNGYQNNSIFSCYASGQTEVYLYKAGEIPQPTYYAINVAEGITNGTVTVDPTTAADGTPIAVTATPATGYELATLTYTYGTETIDIDQTTMQFVMPAADVTVNATFTLIENVATPTFAPEAGTYYEAQNVTIACETEGATIYYTLDGSDPTVESAVYAEPIAIAETTTVKAMAAKAGLNNSEIATAVYTITDGPTPITIAEARALENNQYALVQGVVTFIDNRNIYIQDETAGIDLYLNNNTVPAGLALGDMVLANGKKTVYNGLVELTAINGSNPDEFSIVSNGNELPVAVKTIAEILADAAGTNMLQSTRVQIVEAIIGAINPSNNTPITQGESTMNIYKIPVVEGLQQNDIVTVTGVIGCYNNPQLRIASAADVTFEHPAVQTVSTPTFTPAAGTYYEAQNVTIACTTEGATIYYTLDGTDPTVESTVYAEPIAIAETTTVKAFAVKEGMNDSNIATAVYTIADAPTATDYTLITHNVALVPGDKYLIVGVANDTVFKALGKQASNNRTAVAVTPLNNVINVIPAISNEGGVFELTLGQDSTGYWTLYDAVNGGYLYAASSQSNWLRTQATNDGNGQWTIEIAENGEATVVAQGVNTRNHMRYNDSNSLFSCYAPTSSVINKVYFYKAGEIPQPTYYAVNIAAGIENGTIAVNPTQAYAGATVTVTATPTSGYELATLTYTYGTETFDIDQTTMQFVMPAGDVTVNATFTVQETVSTPTFTPAAGSYLTAQNVTILCTTEDASIYYTLDGSDPTTASTAYTAPITITETTTVKAIAVKAGLNNSEIAIAEYVIIEPMAIAEARLLENDEYALVQGIVTFADNRSIYIQDETAGIVLYLNNNTVPEALTEGDLVQGYGKKTVYKGLVELTGINGGNENEFSIISSGHELPLETVTIAEILADFADENMLQSTRVEIVEATIGTINLNGNTPITQGESTTNIYKIPTVEGLVAGDIVTFAGIIGCYDNPQMRIVSADDVEFYHPSGDPTLTVTPNVLNGFTHVLGEGPSSAQTFVLAGENLPTGLVTITVNNGFEISYNGNLYTGGEITIPVENPTLEPTNIYVRLNGQQVGQYNGTIVVAEGDITATVTLSGSVTPGAGVEETLASFVNVWNNSNEMMFTNDSDKVLNVMVYNMVGQPVLSETIASGNSIIRHDLAEGIYIVRIADGKEMTGIKVVVRR